MGTTQSRASVSDFTKGLKVLYRVKCEFATMTIKECGGVCIAHMFTLGELAIIGESFWCWHEPTHSVAPTPAELKTSVYYKVQKYVRIESIYFALVLTKEKRCLHVPSMSGRWTDVKPVEFSCQLRRGLKILRNKSGCSWWKNVCFAIRICIYKKKFNITDGWLSTPLYECAFVRKEKWWYKRIYNGRKVLTFLMCLIKTNCYDLICSALLPCKADFGHKIYKLLCDGLFTTFGEAGISKPTHNISNEAESTRSAMRWRRDLSPQIYIHSLKVSQISPS